MRSLSLILLLTVAISVAIPVCNLHAYGGGGSGGGTTSDAQESTTENRASFALTNSFPLGVGCGWGIGIVGPQNVIGAGVNPSASPDSEGTATATSGSTDKDAETALNELRSGFAAGTMTAQDIKQDLQWGQQMGVYTSEQAQAVLHDLNIEKNQNQPQAQQQPPATPPTLQPSDQSKFDRDLETINFFLSMMLRDRNWNKAYFNEDEDRWSDSFADRNVKLTYWLLTTLYLKGKYQKGEYNEDIRNVEIRQRLQKFRGSMKK